MFTHMIHRRGQLRGQYPSLDDQQHFSNGPNGPKLVLH